MTVFLSNDLIFKQADLSEQNFSFKIKKFFFEVNFFKQKILPSKQKFIFKVNFVFQIKFHFFLAKLDF